MDIVFDEKVGEFPGHVGGAGVEAECFELVLERLVEVDDIGNGKDIGEGRVFFDEKALDEACAYFDSLKIQSGAVHCWYGEGSDNVY